MGNINQAMSNERRGFELSARAHMLASEFTTMGSVESLDEAIELQSQALSITPEMHIDRRNRLCGLGISLYYRFERLGKLADVDRAIECLTKAMLLTPDGHAGKPTQLNALGSSYARRFEDLGEVGDVDKAIEYLTQAVLLTPDGHAGKPSQLNNLGNSYRIRFERLDEVADLKKAIECHTQAVLLAPDDDAAKACWLNNLGSSYLCRFDRLGDFADVEQAIAYQTKAVLLTPAGNAHKSGRLNSLGISYTRRFERLGEVADVDRAVEALTQAILLTPDGHADKPRQLSNLGNSYQCRFERLGEVSDEAKAINCLTQAVLLTPDGHAEKLARLNNLGTSHISRFERLGKVEDVEKAIECHNQAALFAPEDHPQKPGWINNLGNSYACRFERFGRIADVDKAIEYQTQAVLLTPDGREKKPGWLNNLGISYQRRFEHLGEVTDVDKAIEFKCRAVMLTPDGHADKPSRLQNLGNAYMHRFDHVGQSSDLESAKSHFQSAAQHIVTNPSAQIGCARAWAKCCSSLGISPLPAYERCMELLPQVIWLGTTISQRYDMLTTIGDLATEAAAWAISTQAYDLAIEWLEQGRSIVWNQLLQLRTPFDDLADCNPALADRLKTIATQLEGASTRAAETSPFTNAAFALENDAQRHRRLADEWDGVLVDARSIPGFESFMRPRQAEDLKRSATDGPIVLINTHSTRCDALMIFPQCTDIAHLPLTKLSLAKAGRIREQLYSLARYRGDSDRGFSRVGLAHGPDDPFKCMLGDLWSTIVKPVLDVLAYKCNMAGGELPHVTWCATGALAFLPLHAAGPYDGVLPNACDLVISSYTPTLSALLAPHNPSPTSVVGLLAIGQQETRGLPALPCTVQELVAIEKYAKAFGYNQLDGEKATVNAVLNAMVEYSWVHLACHASQNPHDPARSAFHLHNGDLTLESITKRQFRNKGLAFLSACQTATGDDKLPDEAVHLAAGMLMAGYPSVIATMWPIRDADGPEVAERVYAELLKDGKMDHKGAARALHKAVAGLREKVGEGFPDRWQWVPFIHIGV